MAKTAGSWAKGVSGNPAGRPTKEREARFMRIMSEVVTDDEWRKVVIAALTAAKANDPAARTWLGLYLIGKPAQNITFGEGDDNEIIIRIIDEAEGTDPSTLESEDDAKTDQ